MIGAIPSGAVRRRPDRPGSPRLEAAVIAAMPGSLGRDLLETLYGGWLDEPLWEAYGDLGPARPMPEVDTNSEQDADAAKVPRAPAIDPNTERRLYVQVAELARHAMQLAGAHVRSGTQYRIASTVIAELHGDLSRDCRRCGGSGKSPRSRDAEPCRVCNGRGTLAPSLTTRAEECQCRLPEFRDHLHCVYLTVLVRLRRELVAAKREYARAAALRPIRCASNNCCDSNPVATTPAHGYPVPEPLPRSETCHGNARQPANSR